MSCFLIRWQYQYLTDSVSFLECRQSEDVLREDSDELFVFMVGFFAIDDIVDPKIALF